MYAFKVRAIDKRVECSPHLYGKFYKSSGGFNVIFFFFVFFSHFLLKGQNFNTKTATKTVRTEAVCIVFRVFLKVSKSASFLHMTTYLF